MGRSSKKRKRKNAAAQNKKKSAVSRQPIVSTGSPDQGSDVVTSKQNKDVVSLKQSNGVASKKAGSGLNDKKPAKRRVSPKPADPRSAFRLLPQIFIHPCTAGTAFTEKGHWGASLFMILLNALCSGAFYYALVRYMENIIRYLIDGLNNTATDLLSDVVDGLYQVYLTYISSLVGKIPFIGENLSGSTDSLLQRLLDTAQTEAQTEIEALFQQLANALHAPKEEAFLLGFLAFLVIAVILTVLLAFLFRITKHSWCGFRKSFALVAVYAQSGVLFLFAAFLLTMFNMTIGSVLAAVGLVWRIVWMNSVIIANADEKSRNRTMLLIPLLFLLLYLLHAAALTIISGGSMYVMVQQLYS